MKTKIPQTALLSERYSKNSDISGSCAHLNTVDTHKLRRTAQIHLQKTFAVYVFLESQMPIIQTDGAVCARESLRAVKGRKFPLCKHWLTPSFSTEERVSVMSASGSDDARAREGWGCARDSGALLRLWLTSTKWV